MSLLLGDVHHPNIADVIPPREVNVLSIGVDGERTGPTWFAREIGQPSLLAVLDRSDPKISLCNEVDSGAVRRPSEVFAAAHGQWR